MGDNRMNNVIKINFGKQSDTIDIVRTAASARLQKEHLLSPTSELTPLEAAPSHAAEPIKSLDDIDRICRWYLEKSRYRDYMFFVIGINFGLRVSDLLRLRFCDLINEDMTFKREFLILEKKTKNTRKARKNRCIWINSSVIDAVMTYLENTPSVSLSDYLFKNQSPNRTAANKPMSRQAADNILKEANRALGLNIKMSTHTLRKTFAYHQMAMSNHDPRKLVLLSKMFGHSTVAQTLDYIGLTKEEMEDAYMSLNLGSTNNYSTYCQLGETTAVSA